VTIGRDIDVVDFIVVSREIDGGHRDDGQRLEIGIKGAPDEWKYDLKYRWASARVPADAVKLDCNLDQVMNAVSDFLKDAAA